MAGGPWPTLAGREPTATDDHFETTAGLSTATVHRSDRQRLLSRYRPRSRVRQQLRWRKSGAGADRRRRLARLAGPGRLRQDQHVQGRPEGSCAAEIERDIGGFIKSIKVGVDHTVSQQEPDPGRRLPGAAERCSDGGNSDELCCSRPSRSTAVLARSFHGTRATLVPDGRAGLPAESRRGGTARPIMSAKKVWSPYAMALARRRSRRGQADRQYRPPGGPYRRSSRAASSRPSKTTIGCGCRA